jgi:diguanylate cyclase (GGDEF)-like protein
MPRARDSAARPPAAAWPESDQAQLLAIADIVVEGLVICDGDEVCGANTGFHLLSGLTAAALKGVGIGALFGQDTADAIPFGEPTECILRAANGEHIPVEVVRKAIGDGAGDRQAWAVRDLRERRKADEDIRFLVQHDPLTGLANRAAFVAGMEHLLRAQARHRQDLAVLAIDLDRFKAVNHHFGHAHGDRVLQQVAQRLLATLRNIDLVARATSDEFFVVLDSPVTPDGVAAVADRLLENLRRPYELDNELIEIGASVGIALAPRDGVTVHELMKRADLALTRAKTEGRNAVRFFDPVIDRQVRDRGILEMDLRVGIRTGAFQAFYQPLYSLDTGLVYGFEALARWHHPLHGLLMPDTFIPTAEETGLIVPIGAQILRLAVDQAVAWGGDVSISVNLSAVQIASGTLVDTVRAALRGSGLPPHRLELEITESVLLRDSAATLGVLHALRDLGVRIAMDDFGTGYSSLRYLRSFPFDRIKIDKSFVGEMLVNDESAAIIDAVIGIGRRLGIATTAEGVETEARLSYLRQRGCGAVQGYLIGRPEPAALAARHLVRSPKFAMRGTDHVVLGAPDAGIPAAAHGLCD